GRRSRGDPPALTAEGTVGAVLAVIHARLLEEHPLHLGRQGSLSGLLNPLTGMIVLPYLGQAASQQELSKPVVETRRAKPGLGVRPDPLCDLDMRLTYRTVRVLMAIATHPGASNRQIARTAGVEDQGQISKLLSRLSHLGLIENTGPGHAHGEPNAWTLTHKGHEIQQALTTQATH